MEQLKAKYKKAAKGFTIQEQLDALHSLAKELKAENRVRIANELKGIKVIDIRPDELQLKEN
jgi:hypothetical protein